MSRVKFLMGITAVLIGALLTVFRGATTSVKTLTPEPLAKSIGASSISNASTSTNAFVVRAVDGDTIVAKIDGEEEEAKIRFLGINTPESVDPRRPVQCFGKEASAFVHAELEGKRVFLKADPQADDRDKYHRLLRLVYLEDGTDFNAELVRSGYAVAYVSFPMNKIRRAQLRALERSAKENERGLWNPQTCAGKK